jgi:F-type H+-transporting ATPase subunit alpha
MKQVAGRLRLDLAQYGALSTFAQFGADLDQASRNQLLRGEKATEAMKQDENTTLPVEKEILLVYAAVHGHLDDVPTGEIRDLEVRLYGHLDTKYPELKERIKAKAIDQDTSAMLDKLIAECKQAFTNAEH